MSFLDKLERIFGRFAIPNLTLYFVIGQVFVLLSYLAGVLSLQPFVLVPALVYQGDWWRVLSFMLMPPPPGMFGYLLIAFAWYLFYLMGNALEHYWGTFRYNLFIFAGWALTAKGGVPVLILTLTTLFPTESGAKPCANAVAVRARVKSTCLIFIGDDFSPEQRGGQYSTRACTGLQNYAQNSRALRFKAVGSADGRQRHSRPSLPRRMHVCQARARAGPRSLAGVDRIARHRAREQHDEFPSDSPPTTRRAAWAVGSRARQPGVRAVSGESRMAAFG